MQIDSDIIICMRGKIDGQQNDDLTVSQFIVRTHISLGIYICIKSYSN